MRLFKLDLKDAPFWARAICKSPEIRGCVINFDKLPVWAQAVFVVYPQAAVHPMSFFTGAKRKQIVTYAIEEGFDLQGPCGGKKGYAYFFEKLHNAVSAAIVSTHGYDAPDFDVREQGSQIFKEIK